MNKKILFVYIPKKLEVEQFIKDHPPKEKFKLEHLYYVLGQIRYIAFKSPKNIDKHGYVRVNAQALTNHIKQGSKILKYFVENFTR